MLRTLRRTLLLLPALPAALLLISAALTAADEAPTDAKAEAALKALAERCRDTAADHEKLAQDLQSYRTANLGTPYAVRAAALLSGLPSPLDKLDPATIPDIDRFPWQPKELVAVLGEHRGRQGAAITCVAVSTDGALVASGGGSLIRLWKADDMRLLGAVAHSGVVSVAFSRDGKLLVSGGTDGYVRVWNMGEGEKVALRASAQAATTPVASVAFAPDGKSVAAACGDNNIKIYEVGEKELKAQRVVGDHGQPVTGVAYAPDGKVLVSCGQDKTVRVWDVKPDALEAAAVLETPAAPVGVAVAPNGSALAAWCADGVVCVWNLPAAPKAKPRAELPAAGAAHCAAFTKDGGTLAVACADGAIRLWATNGSPTKERAKLDGHAAAATALAYGPDDKTLVSGGSDWVVRMWDPATKKERFQPFSHLSHVYAVAFSPDGKTLASSAADREMRLWDLKQTPIRTRNYYPPHAGSPLLYHLAASPDGVSLVGIGNTAAAVVVDAATGKTVRELRYPASAFALAWTPDGKRIFGASGKSAALYDAVKGAEAVRFPEHETALGCAALSPDGRLAVSGGGAYLYDKAGKIVIDADGKAVYTDCVLSLCDAASGKELDTIKADRPFVGAVFSPDSRSFYSCSSESIVRQWDASKLPVTELATLTAASGSATGLDVSPDGRTVCTRGLEGKIIVWDAASGKRLQEWTFPTAIGCVSYAPDSRHLAVGLGLGVVYVLRLAEPS